jgi:hypothetical protein
LVGRVTVNRVKNVKKLVLGCLSAAAALVVAGPDPRGQRRRAAAAERRECDARTLRDTRVVVDGRAVYIEPQAFVASGDRLLLAGTPAYVHGRDGEPVLVRRDSAIGVVISVSGGATLLASPISGRFVHDVRATAVREGRWAVAFAEAERVAHGRDDPTVIAYWFGVTDGDRWDRLLRVPVAEGRLRSNAASALVRTTRGLALAVPVERTTPGGDMRSDALVLTRANDRITRQLVQTGSAAYVALAADAAGNMILGVVRPDITETRDENSLFIYRQDRSGRTWRSLPRLVRGLGQSVHEPMIDFIGSRVVVTWRAEPGGAAVGRAIVAESLGDVRKAPVTLGRNAVQVLNISLGDEPAWVLVQPADGAHTPLRVVKLRDASVATIAAAPSLFAGPVAATWLDGRLLMTGGVASRGIAGPPQSHVLSINCAAEQRGGRPAARSGHTR